MMFTNVNAKPKKVLRPKKRFVDESDTNSESDDLDDIPSSEVFFNSKIGKDGKAPINKDFLEWVPYEEQVYGKNYTKMRNEAITPSHSMQFIVLKTTLRAIHMMSGAFVSGTVLLNAFFGVNDVISEIQPYYNEFRLFATIVMILAGIVNVFLIKYGKNLLEHQQLWVRFFELKLVLALALTPMVNPVLFMITDDEYHQEIIRQKIQLFVVLFTLVFSSFIRYYREEKCASFESDEQLALRVKKLQEKLQNKHESGEPIDLVKPDMKKYLGEELNDLMKGKKVHPNGSDSDSYGSNVNSDDSGSLHFKDEDSDHAKESTLTDRKSKHTQKQNDDNAKQKEVISDKKQPQSNVNKQKTN